MAPFKTLSLVCLLRLRIQHSIQFPFLKHLQCLLCPLLPPRPWFLQLLPLLWFPQWNCDWPRRIWFGAGPRAFHSAFLFVLLDGVTMQQPVKITKYLTDNILSAYCLIQECPNPFLIPADFTSKTNLTCLIQDMRDFNIIWILQPDVLNLSRMVDLLDQDWAPTV